MGRLLSKEIVEAAQRGDSQAIRELIEATQTRLYRFSLVLCGDPARAEDLCQEAYLKAIANLNKVTKADSFVPWLFQVTRNLFLDQVRSTRETASLTEKMDKRTAPENAEYYAVHQVLAQFEEVDRWLLMLIDMEEYTYREAGLMLGLTEDAVRSRLFRLRKEFLQKWETK